MCVCIMSSCALKTICTKRKDLLRNTYHKKNYDKRFTLNSFSYILQSIVFYQKNITSICRLTQIASINLHFQ